MGSISNLLVAKAPNTRLKPNEMLNPKPKLKMQTLEDLRNFYTCRKDIGPLHVTFMIIQKQKKNSPKPMHSPLCHAS